MVSSDPDQESFENSEHSDKCSQVQVNGNTAAKKDSSSHADIADQRDDRNEHTDVQEEPGEDLNLADLSAKTEESQVNMLMYSMGDQADDILQSFALPAADQKKYEMVHNRFEQHLVKRCNIIFEQAKFNQRKQEDSETADSFITALYSLTEHCGYGDLYNKMIRDRIVVGVKDAALSEKLQMMSDLDLSKAVNMVHQSEAVKSQQATLRGSHKVKDDSTIDYIKGGSRRG